MNKLSGYFTVDQVASTLQVSQDYVHSLISEGILTGIKLPGRLNSPIRICAESFQKFISNCAVCDIKKNSHEQKVSEKVTSE